MINIHNQKGITFMEVLVSVIILAIGVMGMYSLQMDSMNKFHDSGYFSDAVQTSTFISDSIRTQKNNSNAFDGFDTQGINNRVYVGSLNDCLNVACTDGQIFNSFAAEIESMVEARLPNGRARVAVNNANQTAVITVQWDDYSGNTRTYQTEAPL